MIHTVNGFGIVNKAEIDAFLELSCFFDDPTNVGNLISLLDFNPDLNIMKNSFWKYRVHPQYSYKKQAPTIL